jgi:serine/threonine-protein kinase mTOR
MWVVNLDDPRHGRALDSRFDPFLCQAHHLRSIFLLVNDEMLAIRIDTIKLLGRLAALNPACVLSSMRQTLIRLLIELQFGMDSVLKEEATQILCHFLRAEALHSLVRPFIKTIINILPLQSNARLAAAALEALGDLAVVARTDMNPYLDKLLPIVIENVQDQSSAHKREMALRTLGQLSSSTGNVIKPYFQYSQLLPRIISVLRGGTTIPWSLRREVLRTFGILGALDPYKLQTLPNGLRRASSGDDKPSSQPHDGTVPVPRMHESFDAPLGPGSETHHSGEAPDPHFPPIDEDADEADDGPAHLHMYEMSAMRAQPTDSANTAPKLTPASEDYYPTVAIKALMAILRDPSLSAHHAMVTHAVVFIFKSLGLRCVPFLDHIIPNMLHVVRNCEHGLRESIIQELAVLASIVKHHLRPFLSPIFDLICDYWSDHIEQCVTLVEKLAVYMREDFRLYVPKVLPWLLASLTPQRVQTGATTQSSGVSMWLMTSPNWEGKLDLILHCLMVLRPVLHEHLHIVVPALIKLAEQLADVGPEGQTWQVRSMRTLNYVYRLSGGSVQVSAQSLANRIIHLYYRTLERDALGLDLRDVVMDGLCSMICQLGTQYLIFSELIGKVLASKSIYHAKYANLVSRLYHSADQGSSLEYGPELEFGGQQEEELIAEYLGLNSDEEFVNGEALGHDLEGTLAAGVQRLHVNQMNLQRAWDVSQRSTSEDWAEWIRRFSLELLRESPSPALRSCSALAQVGCVQAVARVVCLTLTLLVGPQVYPPLARELFHAAFVSCWFELQDQHQTMLTRALADTVFKSETIPPDILQVLLNLAEFMEHDVETLPIDIKILADVAQKCHAYAKALHYKELEFQNSQAKSPGYGRPEEARSHPTDIVESLISINKKLGQPEAARGILKYAQKQLGSSIVVKESWLAKLGNWSEALALYRQRRQQDSRDIGAVLGIMKCLDALGQWDESIRLCQESWDVVSKEAGESNAQKKAINLAAHAAWKLGQWDDMEYYVGHLENDVVESAFYRGILAIHNEDFEHAAVHIDHARRLLDNSFTALMAESYNRAYMAMITVQQLAEMEEIIAFRRVVLENHNAEEVSSYKRLLLEKWGKRLQGCRSDVTVWQRVLSVRSLILHPRDHIDAWLQFASLCRQSDNFFLAERVLSERLAPSSEALAPGLKPLSSGDGMSAPGPGSDSVLSTRFKVEYAYVKFVWAHGEKHEALQRLSELIRNLPAEDVKLRVRCLLKLGEWELARLLPGAVLEPSVYRKVADAYQAATHLDACSYSGWHSWALVNFRMVEQLTNAQLPQAQRRMQRGAAGLSASSSYRRTQVLDTRPLLSYSTAAAQGLLRAISLGRRRYCASVQQDLLCLLTIWFRLGNEAEVHKVLDSHLSIVRLDAWLGVLPQLIARIHTRESPVRSLLDSLLCSLGARHPQALVYPLSVALKSPKVERKVAAESLMANLRQRYTTLVEQALLVSSELIRVAILWHELWHEGLEEASRLYFGDGNVKGMLDVLMPLHQQLEAGPKTLREMAFQQAFGNDLSQAYLCIKRYQDFIMQTGSLTPLNGGLLRTGSNGRLQPLGGEAEAALNQAWDLYYTVFRKINKQLPSLTSLDLQYVSPSLLNARNLELAVPGTYRVNGKAVRITYFNTAVQVITSKQRPRKVTMHGEDGKDYLFLLKGHEDLRQDERVMQLFGLVNALLAKDRRTNKFDLSIQRYAVTPLSHNVGIVGWVPHCDTLHALIRDFRETRKQVLGAEHRLMLQKAPDYELLPLMQKVEVFEAALENMTGHDLYKVLWLKSENSEAWLDRRTNYTRSLAVMSMVGYILGLGDRHPSNLMLDRHTGRILHIDFGDCFEVAMHREKFPEKIPFRLTRMLTNAMEVSGIEGNFRCTCEKVLSVLRDNRDSLIAMLEAFVHDPLISWRLLGVTNTGGDSPTTTSLTEDSAASTSHMSVAHESGSPSAMDYGSGRREGEGYPPHWQDMHASVEPASSLGRYGESGTPRDLTDTRPQRFHRSLPTVAEGQTRASLMEDDGEEEQGRKRRHGNRSERSASGQRERGNEAFAYQDRPTDGKLSEVTLLPVE